MTELPGSLRQNPVLSDWIQFENEKAVVRTGKVELGQGISTAIAIIAAEELDLTLDQISVITGRTDSGPNEFITAGSMSIESSGLAMRHAAAEVRGLLVERAAQLFDVDADSLIVDNGVIINRDGNEGISYWELVRDQGQVNAQATGQHTPKTPDQYHLVGQPAPRLDLAEKVYGGKPFIQDLELTGLHHARVIRPPNLNWSLASIDTDNIGPEIRLVIDGSFVGVVARDEAAAIEARHQLEQSIVWNQSGAVPAMADLRQYLHDAANFSLLVENGTPTDTPIPDRLTVSSGLRLEAQYLKPYHLHGSIGPSAAFARYHQGELLIYSHTQGPSILQNAIAQVLRLDVDKVTVQHRENAGCYGHNGADDAAMDAALLAYHLPDVPILLSWQRVDEHRCEPLSPGTAIDMDATVKDGRILCWNADIYSQSHSGRPSAMQGASNFIAAWQRKDSLPRPPAKPGRGSHSGIHRNADPYYDIDNKRITKNLVADQRIRTSSTRSLGAFANVFAIETFMDELACAADIDPVTFRLNHLRDPRAIDVLTHTAERLEHYQCAAEPGWLVGKGLAFARYKNTKTYAAIGMVLRVHEETFAIQMLHSIITADSGLIIDPDGLANQLEGGMLQAASWTLKEALSFDTDGITGADWDSYPILTFPEIPTVDVKLLDQPHEPSVGAGEATQGPTPAAISNAIYNATKVRLRDMPFTPERLRSNALS
jgi:nicotinate dehydrogenase subunit B